MGRVRCAAIAALLLLPGCGVSRDAAVTRGVGITDPDLPTVPTPGGPAGADTTPELVSYPSPEVAFILGPQLKAGSAANPWPWFDQNEIARGLVHGAAFPTVPRVAPVTGTLSIDHGTRTVLGAGTRFSSELAGGGALLIRDEALGTYLAYQVASIQSDSSLTLSQDWWPGSVTGVVAQRPIVSADQEDAFLNAQYYDLGLCLYLAYYRSGDARLLQQARDVADAWWRGIYILEGANRDFGNTLAPRNVSLGSLMLRALDGRPEMWPWITEYTRVQFDTWVGRREDYDGLYYGVRDGGYMLLYAAWLGAVHPDPAVRAEFRAKAVAAAQRYYLRLQRPDGSWRWDDAGETNFEEPFMVGLLLDGLIAVHRMTGDGAVASSIVRAVEHLHTQDFRTDSVAQLPGLRWRGFYYANHCASCPWGSEQLAGGSDRNTVREVRQLNATVVHAYGYAYLLTHDPRFRAWGDEVFAATYGHGQGPLADDLYGLADYLPKQYNQSYRSSGHYLVWRNAP